MHLLLIESKSAHDSCPIILDMDHIVENMKSIEFNTKQVCVEHEIAFVELIITTTDIQNSILTIEGKEDILTFLTKLYEKLNSPADILVLGDLIKIVQKSVPTGSVADAKLRMKKERMGVH